MITERDSVAVKRNFENKGFCSRSLFLSLIIYLIVSVGILIPIRINEAHRFYFREEPFLLPIHLFFIIRAILASRSFEAKPSRPFLMQVIIFSPNI